MLYKMPKINRFPCIAPSPGTLRKRIKRGGIIFIYQTDKNRSNHVRLSFSFLFSFLYQSKTYKDGIYDVEMGSSSEPDDALMGCKCVD